jgi:signal transduction histidine kinase
LTGADRSCAQTRPWKPWVWGGVADVRGNYIWELLALLDKQGGEDRGHSLANWCSQVRDDWLTHWQNAADHDGVEWLIQSPTLDPLYCIHMNLVNLGTSTSHGVEAHAVILVDDMSNSLDRRTKPISFSTATAVEHSGQGNGPNLIRRDNEESSGELLDAQERERTRIALELHDGIGQMMTIMKLQCDCILQELDDTHLPSGHVKRLGDLRESMAGAIEEVRRIGINLRPPMLDDLGIGPTLRWFFNECAKSDPGFKISAQIDIDENLLSSELETDIFRITQEATNNVVKHAHASNLQYSLQTQGDQVKLAIIDDGDGFAAGQSKLDGAGIRNLIKRVAMRGGQLDLVAVPVKGVELRACWKI